MLLLSNPYVRVRVCDHQCRNLHSCYAHLIFRETRIHIGVGTHWHALASMGKRTLRPRVPPPASDIARTKQRQRQLLVAATRMSWMTKCNRQGSCRKCHAMDGATTPISVLCRCGPSDMGTMMWTTVEITSGLTVVGRLEMSHKVPIRRSPRLAGTAAAAATATRISKRTIDKRRFSLSSRALFNNDKPESRRQTRSSLNALKQRLVLGKPIHIDILHVHRGWRNLGFGGKLLGRVTQDVGRHHKLLLDVCPFDNDARGDKREIDLERFYRSFGFKPLRGSDDRMIRGAVL